MDFDWSNPPFNLDSSLKLGEIEESFEDPFAVRLLPDSARFAAQARFFNLGVATSGTGIFTVYKTNGKQVRVRAVLERTVVIEHHEGGERSVVRKDNCMVKPSAVAFVPGNPNNGVGPRQWRRLPGKPPATPRPGP